jgi:hypothetical protein
MPTKNARLTWMPEWRWTEVLSSTFAQYFNILTLNCPLKLGVIMNHQKNKEDLISLQLICSGENL